MNVENSAHQRQEIPTHLEVEDRLVFGLTLRQGIVVLVGCALGYTLYAQLGHLPWPGAGSGGHMPLALRIAGACIPALVAFAVAAIQPAGRPLEEWLFALLRYAALPKRCVWRPHLNTSIGRSLSSSSTMGEFTAWKLGWLLTIVRGSPPSLMTNQAIAADRQGKE